MERPAMATIRMKVRFFPLAFFLFFCRPTIVIDGIANQVRWGTHEFPVAPGSHTVKVFFRYLFMKECGANSVDVMVQEGGVPQVSFYMLPWMFAKGRMKVLQG